MARIRTIKPEFWSSEQVMECSTNARLLFIGMWNFCDDAGRHPANPKQLKALVFPGDSFCAQDVAAWIDELARVDLIRLYHHEGRDFFYVTGWSHQRIDRAQDPKFPDPRSGRGLSRLQSLVDHSTNDRGTLPSRSNGPAQNGTERPEFTSLHQTGSEEEKCPENTETPKSSMISSEFDDPSVNDQRMIVAGREGKGKDSNIDTSLRSVSRPNPAKPVRTRKSYTTEYEEFWSVYPTDRLMSKSEAFKVWARLTPENRQLATASIPNFIGYCRANPNYRPVHACRYLSQGRFEGFEKPGPTGPPTKLPYDPGL